jgi:hypothetical protein
MTKTKTADKAATKTANSAEVKKAKKATVTATAVDDDLDALAVEALELEHKEREQFQVSNVIYVSIVGRMSQATMKSKPGYIPGAKMGDIVTSTKEILGQEAVVTVLGIFKLYGEFEADTEDEKGKRRQGALKRYIMPDDAAQLRALSKEAGLPVDNFDTTLPNGHVIRPLHWIHLYLHDKPEIMNAVFSLRSSGNKVAFELSKLIQQSEVAHSVELRFILTHREESNEQGEWFVPEFTFDSQRNCKVEDGKFNTVKGGFARKELAEVLKLSTEQRRAYDQCKLVSSVDVKAIFGTAHAQRAIGAPAEYEDDEEEEDDKPKKKLRF